MDPELSIIAHQQDDDKDNVQYVASFLLNNLRAFAPHDSVEEKYLDKTIRHIEKEAKKQEACVDDLLYYLARYQTKHYPRKRHFPVLLFTLRQQVEKSHIFHAMDASKLYPKEHYQRNSSLRFEAPNSRDELIHLMQTNEEARDCLKQMALVCVYGNVDSHGNTVGHALLSLGDLGYLHINGLRKKPEFVSHHTFRDYLKKQNSFVVDVKPIFSKEKHLKPEKLQQYANIIEAAAKKTWFWKITFHNCLSFVFDVAKKCGIKQHKLGMPIGDARLPIPYCIKSEKTGPLSRRHSKEKERLSKKIHRQLVKQPYNNMKETSRALLVKFFSKPLHRDKVRVDILDHETPRALPAPSP